MGTHRCVLVAILAGLAGVRALAAGADAPRGERYALLVGVRKYDATSELRALKYPEKDMDGLQKVLIDGGYRPENIVLMTQTAGAEETRFLPMGAKVRDELKILLRDRTEADSVIVAFAGHGVQFKDDDQAYFCPVDARLNDKTTLISLREVYQILERCPAGHKLLLSDACRNDPIDSNSRRAVVDLVSASRPQRQPRPKGVAALFSCSEGQLAYEHDALKHGVFFHYVIKGLEGEADSNGDRRINFDELAPFARDRVKDHVRRYFDGREQFPFSESKSNSDDFTLISVRTPVPVPTPFGPAQRKPAEPGPPAKAETSVLAPRVRIIRPEGGTTLKTNRVLVRVEAMPEDEEPVTRIRMFLNGKPAQGQPEQSEKSRDTGGRFESQWLTLRPGRNEIGVEAANRARSSARTTLAVNYDPSPTTSTRRTMPKPGAGQSPYLGLVRHPLMTFATKGVYLGAPHFESPASKAGIKSQDILIRFNGKSIDLWRDYKASLARCSPGQTAKVEVERLGQRLKFDVNLVEGKEDE